MKDRERDARRHEMTDAQPRPLQPRPGQSPSRRDTPFGTGIHLGRWLGVEVRAHWSVLIVLALFVVVIAEVELPASQPGSSTAAHWTAAAVMAPLLFVTLLAHELAHALAARHYGLGVHRITLWMLGGLTELEGEAPSPRADALIAAAGPLTSLTLGGLCAGTAQLAPEGFRASTSTRPVCAQKAPFSP